MGRTSSSSSPPPPFGMRSRSPAATRARLRACLGLIAEPHRHISSTLLRFGGMRRPNLFDFATSELSQDAFLCWLIACAGHEENVELWDLGRAFIGWLWSASHHAPVGHEHVRLLSPPRRQVEHIDILFDAEVAGRRTRFVIEDKTDTSHHHD